MKHTMKQYTCSGCTIQLQLLHRGQAWRGGGRTYWQVWTGSPVGGQMIDHGMAENEHMARLHAQEVIRRHRRFQVTAEESPGCHPDAGPVWTLQDLLKAAGFPEEQDHP